MKSKRKDNEEQTALTRIAIVNPDLCKPKKCSLECKRVCPINMQGKQCIVVDKTSPVSIMSEELCIGCGQCVKRCPFNAITIVNLPSNLSSETTHRYGPNSFKLHRLPLPRPGQVLGLVGPNGTGKSTALKILSGKLKPNLGKYREELEWDEIIRHYRGSEFQSYFQFMRENKLKTVIKPQHDDREKNSTNTTMTVRESLENNNECNKVNELIDVLDLKNILDTSIKDLSGGEYQRVMIALVCNKNSNVYMFDEPSSFLDVRQRLQAANAIRDLITPENYVICVEHDLAVVDYLSDYVCVLYGSPGHYGVVTSPYGCREGINVFLDGFIPTENMRFREGSVNFKLSDNIDNEGKKLSRYQYSAMKKKLGNFELTVTPGQFNDSEIIVLLGENGCGKTTLIRMLAGHIKPDEGDDVPQLAISYKPQIIKPKFDGSVKDLLQSKINSALQHAQFVSNVVKPMHIEDLYNFDVQNLSGGELQRVAITLALGTPANVYLLDEPSAHLDSDQRIIASKVIKRFILHAKKTAFVVEHDFVMATYLADRVIVYDGTPARSCTASEPTNLLDGMNKFLKGLDLTIRRDPFNYRPRINKHNSVKDREQKASGNYFYMMSQTDDDAIVSGNKPTSQKQQFDTSKAKVKNELNDIEDFQ
jgi:ATP-binding cassette, sub-family E, member 1